MAGQPYVQHREKRYRRKDGGVIWTEVDAFLAPVAGSEPLLAGVAVDITERKLAEEALRDAQADLERMARLTTMGELTASIAHEINQPLAAIVTQSEAALRFLDRDEPDLDEVQDGRRGSADVRLYRAETGRDRNRSGFRLHRPLRQAGRVAERTRQRRCDRRCVLRPRRQTPRNGQGARSSRWRSADDGLRLFHYGPRP